MKSVKVWLGCHLEWRFKCTLDVTFVAVPIGTAGYHWGCRSFSCLCGIWLGPKLYSERLNHYLVMLTFAPIEPICTLIRDIAGQPPSIRTQCSNMDQEQMKWLICRIQRILQYWITSRLSCLRKWVGWQCLSSPSEQCMDHAKCVRKCLSTSLKSVKNNNLKVVFIVETYIGPYEIICRDY